MFGVNEIKGKSFFNQIDKLLVTSIFLTIQGEGPYQGQPAVFVRLTHCNLNCSWCDTFFDQGDWFTVHELTTRVFDLIKSKYIDLGKCGIVVTGGEPSLQANIFEFLLNCEAAKVAFTQIESNGIIPFAKLPTATTVVISPKCSEKTHKYLMPNDDSLSRANCLKFVITVDPDSPYHRVPEWAFDWQKATGNPIYVSPMNMYRPAVLENARLRMIERKSHNLAFRSTIDEVVSGWDDTVLDREANRKNHMYAAAYALNRGIYLTLQMHLFASIA